MRPSVKKYWNDLVRLLDIEEEGYTQDPSGTMDGVCKALLDNKDMLQNQIQFNDLALRTRSNGLGFLVDRYLEGASHEEIMGIFKDSDEEAPTTFKVGSGKSKAGRPFITCDIA